MKSSRRTKILIYCLFCMILTSCSQNTDKVSAIKVRHDTLQLNHVKGPVDFTFTIFSVGNDTLKILKHATSCGCTQVSIDKKAIAPGDSAVLKGVYTPEVKGRFEKTIVLNTNDKKKFHVLRLRGFSDTMIRTTGR